MLRFIGLCILTVAVLAPAEQAGVHVWEKHEITLQAENTYGNAYVDVVVWVDLKGPDFQKRVYGFWDGGRTFRVRMAAATPGRWVWRSGSAPEDAGLSGKSGEFDAAPWTEAEKMRNPARRGFPRATSNRHALEYPDGTPFFLLGDTWWAAPTDRLRWYDDDLLRPLGPDAGFKDYVQFRKRQGFNSIAMIAAFPAWDQDGLKQRLDAPDGTVIRSQWSYPGTDKGKRMANGGGRPFLFPGRIPGFEKVFPDLDRINPEYFRELDKKIDCLNENGFIPFIEVVRRDIGQAWKKYYDWPESYARYVQYVFSRYQANNAILSPIHYDYTVATIPAREFVVPIEMVMKKYGPPPFGTLISLNPHLSSFVLFGSPDWLTLHQMGNHWREHDSYWSLTEIFESSRPRPALNGEPYYSGHGRAGPPLARGGTERDSRFCRSAMYGSFLSGGFAGHIYGARGIVEGNVEPEADPKMWDSFRWESAAQMQHLRTFAFSQGKRYQELLPNADLISPNKTSELRSFDGWAFCARTPDRHWFLLYFEQGWTKGVLRGALAERSYRARWFNPRTGQWRDGGEVKADVLQRAEIQGLPDEQDWALSLEIIGD